MGDADPGALPHLIAIAPAIIDRGHRIEILDGAPFTGGGAAESRWSPRAERVRADADDRYVSVGDTTTLS
jgi:hypothetical protein